MGRGDFVIRKTGLEGCVKTIPRGLNQEEGIAVGMKRMTCKCDDFKKWLEIEKGAWILLLVHGVKYTGPNMKFCPFCGERLKEVGASQTD